MRMTRISALFATLAMTLAFQVVAKQSSVLSGLSKEVINEGVKKYKKSVNDCYEPALKTNPKLEGKVSVAFTITPEGKVSNADVRETTINNPVVESCVVRATQEMTFPKNPDNVPTHIVAYPFYFKPFQKTVFTHKQKNPMVKDDE
jgi:TonB family protein